MPSGALKLTVKIFCLVGLFFVFFSLFWREEGQKRNFINLFLILFYIEVSLINNVVLVSGV